MKLNIYNIFKMIYRKLYAVDFEKNLDYSPFKNIEEL